MSRYRKIEVKTWSDEKFRRLSPLPPSGQGLWLFLMTGPHTGPIPGLFRAGRAGMAEELGWEIEAFDEAFGEVSSQGMVKADFKARLVWLPNALKHNKPESPNVVRSWRAELDLLPECELKAEAIRSIGEHLASIGEAYVRAFHEALFRGETDLTPSHGGDAVMPSGKALAKPSPKTMANQEQEQEQDKYNPQPPAGGERVRPSSTEQAGFVAFWKTWPASRRKGSKTKCHAVWGLEKLEASSAQILAHVEALKRSDDWTKQNGQYIPAPLVYLNQRRWEGADLEMTGASNDEWWRHAV